MVAPNTQQRKTRQHGRTNTFTKTRQHGSSCQFEAISFFASAPPETFIITEKKLRRGITQAGEAKQSSLLSTDTETKYVSKWENFTPSFNGCYQTENFSGGESIH